MAEGGGSEEDGVSLVATGSEFVFDFYCEVCRDDCKHIEAAGFCVECSEYLCEACFNAHRRSRPTRYHTLLDKAEMPKDTPLSQDRVSKDITTMCTFHSGEVVKFYCKPHGVFGCSTCFVTGHRDCSGIETILDKSENVLDSEEFKDFIQHLKSMQHKSRDMIEKVRENISNTERCCSEAVSAVRELRQHINTVFDGIEQHFITQAGAIASEQVDNMESLTREFSDISEKIESISSEVDHLQTSRRVCQLFIKMKETASGIKSLEKRLSEAEERSVAKSFNFEPSNGMNEFLKNTDAFGKMSVKDRNDGIERSASGFKDVSNRTVHVSDIDVMSNSDKQRCYIIGSAVLSNDRLVIADHSNHKVKLLDTQSNNILKELGVSSSPCDIAVLSKDQIAVTRFYGKILLIRIEDAMTLEREITVNGKCRGVAYSQGKLLVTFVDIPRLEIMDLQGNVIKRVEYDGDGRKLFENPRHVCVSKDGTIIYVSDKSSNKVISLTFDGVVGSVFNGVKCLQGICADQHGNIYVCGEYERNVQLLSPNCTLLKVILTQTHGLASDVLSVSHCQDTNRLFVGMKHSYIKVFQLT